MRASLVVLCLSCFACETATPASSPSSPVDAGNVDGNVVSTCPPVTGAGTKHDAAPMADETWTTAASPHVVGTRLAIPAGKTITVEPCAVVRLAEGMLVEGKLVALGAADRPIKIERAEPSKSWTSIETRQGSEVRLSYVTVEGGGGNGAPGALDVRGDQETATQGNLFVDHVSVSGSETTGVNVREGGGFAAGSNALTVTGAKSFPVSIWLRAVGTLPTGTYTGNATDEILLPAIGGRDNVAEDTTMADRGVPYRVGSGSGSALLGVEGASVPLLTIEAGVTLRFTKGARLHVDGTGSTANGALRIAGTSDRPVVLTSAEATPAAGDWVGVVLEGTPDPRTSVTHAKIAYAGASSQVSSFGCQSPGSTSFANDAAIVIAGGKPASAFVTQTIIDQSAGEGIVRGWTGGEVDFLPTNTFTNVARCNQTFPKPDVGACPDPAPCPK